MDFPRPSQARFASGSRDVLMGEMSDPLLLCPSLRSWNAWTFWKCPVQERWKLEWSELL